MKPCAFEGFKCTSHGCDSTDPCLKKGCPHCGSGTSRRYTRAVTDLDAAQRQVQTYERKAHFYLGRLMAARKRELSARKRLEKLEAQG